LADRLIALTSDPEARNALRAGTEQIARERTWPAIAARHIELYAEVSR
jgi:glycosyltransferase involved in cell wall biosynthesis